MLHLSEWQLLLFKIWLSAFFLVIRSQVFSSIRSSAHENSLHLKCVILYGF